MLKQGMMLGTAELFTDGLLEEAVERVHDQGDILRGIEPEVVVFFLLQITSYLYQDNEIFPWRLRGGGVNKVEDISVLPYGVTAKL